MNLLQKYEKWVSRINYLNGHTNSWDEWYQPYYHWNPFDSRNYYWTPLWLDRYMSGWKSVGYCFGAWSYRMTDRYYHRNPGVFWAEINDGWLDMYYSNQLNKMWELTSGDTPNG